MKRVFVGMSGGVDSSVAAKRLIQRGYDVTGVFIKVWQPDFIHCDWEKERLDAMRVAAHLGIPFLTMNAEDAYKREVAEYMVNAYKDGLTPNPDVMCNEFVKFGAFFTWAREHGADYVATGHYAQVKETAGVFSLHKAVDTSKDQSYFLARIHNDVLPYVLFPIGDTLKSDIRKEAERARIPTATKADSQGICFLGQIDMKTFLGHYLELVPGKVLDTNGQTIGEHSGALLYTIGQRHGFQTHQSGGDARPQYVIGRNLEDNTITVDTSAPQSADTINITLRHIHRLGNGFTTSMHAVFRYHGESEPVEVTESKDGTTVILHTANTSVHTPAKGQVCVLYSGDECCGSGIIS
jgi:tRNA-uridine 2-sulfurtransferase